MSWQLAQLWLIAGSLCSFILVVMKLDLGDRETHWDNSQSFIRAGITEVWIHSLSECVYKGMHMSIIDRVEERDAASVPVQQHSDLRRFLLQVNRRQYLIWQALPIFPLVVSYMPQALLWEDFSVLIGRLRDHTNGPGWAVSHLNVPAVFPRIESLRAQDARVVSESQRVHWKVWTDAVKLHSGQIVSEVQAGVSCVGVKNNRCWR